MVEFPTIDNIEGKALVIENGLPKSIHDYMEQVLLSYLPMPSFIDGINIDKKTRDSEVRFMQFNESNSYVREWLIDMADRYSRFFPITDGVERTKYSEKGSLVPEPVQVTTYRKQNFYNWHVDGSAQDARHMTIIAQLTNDNEYEGGNFENFSKFWEKKSEQIDKYSNFFEFQEFLEKNPMIEKSIVLTAKKIKSDFKGDSWRRPLGNLIITDNEIDQDTFYNDDYNEYYAESKYALIYDGDGEYRMSTRTRSTTNKLVKAVIDEELKGERKDFKDLLKLLKQ